MTGPVLRRVQRRWLRSRESWRWRVLDGVAGVARRTADGRVALTFDDGPHPGSTDRVLDVLASLGVPATFFCVGRNAAAHPELVLRARAEGHAVGSHSHTHPDPERTSLRELARDYARGADAVSTALGEPVRLFRPPRGYLDGPRALQLRRTHRPPWLWTIDPQDWRPGAVTADLVAVVSGAGPGDVVLLHDWIEQPWGPAALDRSATVGALTAAVAALRARGLAFTLLS